MRLAWDKTGERRYETGVSKGVLYVQSNVGTYPTGIAWNGLTAVTESPSGAESNKQYADNHVYVNLLSAEEFGCTIEAFTYPDEFEQCDGTAEVVPGVKIGQQSRKPFGFSYETLIGTDTEGTDAGKKIHIVWNALAAPSEKAYATVNDSPEAMTLSWEISTTPTAIAGYKPVATMTIDSTKISAGKLKKIEDALYGTDVEVAHLPLPDEIVALLSGDDEITPQAPTQSGNTLTIPSQPGVIYSIDGTPVTGTYTLTENETVTATADDGYTFPGGATTSWPFTYTP